MFPIPSKHHFEPLGANARFGSVITNGVSIKIEWYDQIPVNPSYKSFLELVCSHAAETRGHNEVHIRSKLHPSSTAIINGKKRRVKDDWHVTADFGGHRDGLETGHICAGPNMEKGKKDISDASMGIWRPDLKPNMEWYPVRRDNHFAKRMQPR